MKVKYIFFRQKTVTSRCDLQEILKEFLQAEGKWYQTETRISESNEEFQISAVSVEWIWKTFSSFLNFLKS